MMCASSLTVYATTGSPGLTLQLLPATSGSFPVLRLIDSGSGVACPVGSYMLTGPTSELALLGITAPEILTVFSWGFSVMLFGWLCGYGVSLALGLIRRV